MDDWIAKALALGFTEAGALDAAKLEVRADVRDMCAADRCHLYGRSWTCPPACGTLEACAQRMHRHQNGILLQTVGQMRRKIDARAYFETEKRHKAQFRAYAALVRAEYPDALCLGSGGCGVCKTCAYPEPCRFPEQAFSSMEGYGLLVTQVCCDNGLPYYHGSLSVTYTACVLF